jgi:hypothetical protein
MAIAPMAFAILSTAASRHRRSRSLTQAEQVHVQTRIVALTTVATRVQRTRHAHGTRGGKIEAAGEHGKPSKKLLLGGLQQVVTPIDGGSQRLMSHCGGATDAPQERKSILEMGNHFRSTSMPISQFVN